jgi:hypothetical protein
MVEELIGHVGFLLIFIGMWSVGRKSSIGFICQSVGSFILAGVGFVGEYYFLTFWSTIFAGVGIFGYVTYADKDPTHFGRFKNDQG